MTGLQMAMAIVLVLNALITIIIVMLQKDRDSTINGAISGGDTSGSGFFDKTKGKRKEDRMINVTRVLIGLLLAFSVAATCVLLFV